MPVTHRLLKDKRSQKYDNITILCVLVDKTKYEEGISSQILAHNRQCRDLVPICVQAEKVVYIWSPSSPPSLLATFIPLVHSFGAFPLCNPTKTSQHYSVSAKDFRKLLDIHMLSQATVVSSALLQILSFLHWWPPCWLWDLPRRPVGAQQPLVSMGLASRRTVMFRVLFST